MIDGSERPSSQVMSPSEKLGADNKKKVQSSDAKASKSTKIVATSDGSNKKASISESSKKEASNLTDEEKQAMAERVQTKLEEAKSNPVPELEGEALLEDYQTAEDDDEDADEKRQRIFAERVAKGLSPFIREEDILQMIVQFDELG